MPRAPREQEERQRGVQQTDERYARQQGQAQRVPHRPDRWQQHQRPQPHAHRSQRQGAHLRRGYPLKQERSTPDGTEQNDFEGRLPIDGGSGGSAHAAAIMRGQCLHHHRRIQW